MSPEIQKLEQRITELENRLNKFVYIDRFQFEKDIAHKGKKLGFFSAAPVAQLTTNGVNANHWAVGGTNVQTFDQFDGTYGITRYTINDIVRYLKTIGLLSK